MSRNRRSTAVVSLALVVGAVSVTGCSVVRAAHKIANTVEGNKRVIDAFTTNLNSGGPSSFEAVYATTGATPATIVYGAQPPNEVAITDSPSSGGGTDVDLVTNNGGPYSCTRPNAGAAKWSCQIGSGGTAAQEQALVDIYTPAHWVRFLDDVSVAAGFAGDKVTTSTMSVNGFAMKCVDFEITSFSSSPPASLFAVPAGATITATTVPPSAPSR